MKSYQKYLMLLIVPCFLFAKGMVVGYMPDYRAEPTDAQLQKVTHIIAFSLQVNSDGSLNTANVPSWLNSTFAQKVHTNGAKVAICVGGWGRSGGFSAATSTNKTTFINNLVTFMTTNGLDGIDIDWEYPSTGEMASFGTFLTDLKAAMGSTKNLSIAVGGGHIPSEFPKSLYQAVDFIHLMAYDMHGTWSSQSAYQESIDLINSYWSHASSLNVGFEKSQLVLGVPFYTRGAGVLTWGELLTTSNNACVNSDTWGGYDYNGIPTMQEKTSYCYTNGFGGIMIWELAQDVAVTHQYSLLKAINDTTDALGGYVGGTNYVITASAGVGGSITPSGAVAVDSATSKSFTISANQWYLIDDVTVDGVSVGAVTSYTFPNVTATHTISATFVKDPAAPTIYTLSTTASANGSIAPSGAITVVEGADTTLAIIPNASFMVSSVLVDGINRGPIVSATFKNMRADHTIAASFSAYTGTENYPAWDPTMDYGYAPDTVTYAGKLWVSQWWPKINEIPMDDPVNNAWLFIRDIVAANSAEAMLEYRGAQDGSDTLIITTDSLTGGVVTNTVIDTIILGITPVRVPHVQATQKFAVQMRGQTILFTAPQAGTYKVSLFTAAGRQIVQKSLTLSAQQRSTISAETFGLSRGVYMLQIVSPKGFCTTQKMMIP